MTAFELTIIFWAGHYLADFPLQPSYVAEHKGKVFVESIGFHCLTAHAFIHGLIAGILAASFGFDWFAFGLVIGLTHWLIDFLKSSILIDDRFPHTKGARNQYQNQGLYGINIDQSLHFIVIVICVLIFK